MRDAANIAEAAAASVRTTMGIPIDSPVGNVTNLVENAGVPVLCWNDVCESIDAFSVHLQRPLVVHGLRSVSTSRARFNIAHELGHLLLHANSTLAREAREGQANQFAGALLLPRIALIREWPRTRRIHWPSLYRIKQRWGVSLESIVMRANQAGMISPVEYRRAFALMRSKWGKKAPEPYEPPGESPNLIPQALRIAEEDRVLPDIERRIGLSQRQIEKLVSPIAEAA